MEKLTIEGMSSDESDVERPVSSRLIDQRRVHSAKVVRRVRLPWLNNDISELLDAVETYDDLRPPGAVPDGRGKPPFPRLFNAVHCSNERAAKPKLPRNWYDDEWFKQCSISKKYHLAASENVEIPKLVCCY